MIILIGDLQSAKILVHNYYDDNVKIQYTYFFKGFYNLQKFCVEKISKTYYEQQYIIKIYDEFYNSTDNSVSNGQIQVYMLKKLYGFKSSNTSS